MRCKFAALAAFVVTGAFGATLVSENFSGVLPGTYGAGQSIGAFTVTAGSVDVVSGGFFGSLCTGSETQPCVDLSGSDAGTISTTSLALAPAIYTLAFHLNGTQRGPNASATVSLGSLFNQTFNYTSGQTNSITANFNVFSPTNAPLIFQSNTPGVYGLLLDNVSLTSTPLATPEPSTVMLLGSALLSLAAVRRARS